MMKREIKKLKDYLSGHPEVLMAFLFGSRGQKSMAGKISDWDIAIYFRPKRKGVLEWEEIDRRYPNEDKIWLDLVDILKTDNIDLVVLNRVAANIAASAINGIPLVVKDYSLFLDFALRVSCEAEDYHRFVDDYYEILEKSTSLLPEEKEKLKKTISFLEEQMSLYSYFYSFVFKDYQNIHKRLEVERWVENMINAVIDIGKIILASQKVKIPSYYKEVLTELSSIPKFQNLDLEKLASWVKLRNILAHEYLDIKWKRIEEFIKESQPYLNLFLKNTKKVL